MPIPILPIFHYEDDKMIGIRSKVGSYESLKVRIAELTEIEQSLGELEQELLNMVQHMINKIRRTVYESLSAEAIPDCGDDVILCGQTLRTHLVYIGLMRRRARMIALLEYIEHKFAKERAR